MKIRCVTNSIRYRLRKSDFQKLQANTLVEEAIIFPTGARFVFSLQLIQEEYITATFNEGRLCVHLPTKQAESWINSNAVSIEENLPMTSNQSLHILLEKDFPCGHTDKDREDTFYELVEQQEIC